MSHLPKLCSARKLKCGKSRKWIKCGEKDHSAVFSAVDVECNDEEVVCYYEAMGCTYTGTVVELYEHSMKEKHPEALLDKLNFIFRKISSFPENRLFDSEVGNLQEGVSQLNKRIDVMYTLTKMRETESSKNDADELFLTCEEKTEEHTVEEGQTSDNSSEETERFIHRVFYDIFRKVISKAVGFYDQIKSFEEIPNASTDDLNEVKAKYAKLKNLADWMYTEIQPSLDEDEMEEGEEEIDLGTMALFCGFPHLTKETKVPFDRFRQYATAEVLIEESHDRVMSWESVQLKELKASLESAEKKMTFVFESIRNKK